MGYQFNVLTGKFDRAGEGTEGPAGTVSAAGDGTATAPSISFSSDTNTGLYKSGTDSISITTGGVTGVTVDSSQNTTFAGNILLSSDNLKNIGDGTNNFNSIWASNRFRGNDKVTLSLGSSQDFKVVHANETITVGGVTHTSDVGNVIGSPTGHNLYIKSGTSDQYDTHQIDCLHNNAVKLYYSGSEKFSTTSTGVHASEKVLIGHDSSIAVGSTAAANLQTHATANSILASFTGYSSNSGGGHIVLGKSRGAIGTPGTAVSNLNGGDNLGGIRFAGDDGDDVVTQAALIVANVDGTVASNQIPGELVFSTANSTGAMTAALTISSSQSATFAGEITTPRFETQDLGIKVIGKDGGTAQIDIQPDLGDSNADKWKVGAEDNGHFFISNKDSGDWDKSIAANRSGNAELYFDGGAAKFGTTASGAIVTHSTAASTLKLYRSDTPGDDDNIADLFFLGKKSDGADHTYGYIRSTVTDVTTGTTDSKLTFATKTDGSDKEIVFQDGGANFAGHIQFSGSTSSLTNISQPIITRSGSSDGSYPFDGHGHLILQSRGDGSNRDIVFATGTNGANKTIFAASGNATFPGDISYPKSTPDGEITVTVSGSALSDGAYMTIIPAGTTGIVDGATYIVSIYWHYASGTSAAPWHVTGGTVWVPTTTNDNVPVGGDFGHEVQLMSSFHADQGSNTNYYLKVRPITGSSVLSGLQVAPVGWSPSVSSEFRIKYKRIM